jgi:adenylate cyclase
MILDLAKIDAGKMRFDMKRQDLRQILDAVLQRRGEEIVDHGNTVSVSIEASVAEVTTDGNRLAQIIDGIVSNAAAATQDGTISIAARPGQLRRAPAFEIAISDTGCGIPAELLPVIFDIFLTDRQAADGRYGGTGLALSVTGKLCEAMGGRITVDSVEGVGSTFTITLPMRPAASAAGSATGDLSAAA